MTIFNNYKRGRDVGFGFPVLVRGIKTMVISGVGESILLWIQKKKGGDEKKFAQSVQTPFILMLNTYKVYEHERFFKSDHSAGSLFFLN